MTRFIWDKFSKDYLETFLSPYGEVKISVDVTTETKEIKEFIFYPTHSEQELSYFISYLKPQKPCG